MFYIKAYLKKRLTEYIESGVEWIIISGQLGIEQWSAEVVFDLKKDYPEVKLGILLPYEGVEKNWNSTNQQFFEHICAQADYVNVTSKQEYQNPEQLKMNQSFILQHTDGALLIYDSENPGKPGYLLDMIQKYQKNVTYELDLVAFDELQWFVTEYEESSREDS